MTNGKAKGQKETSKKCIFTKVVLQRNSEVLAKGRPFSQRNQSHNYIEISDSDSGSSSDCPDLETIKELKSSIIDCRVVNRK